MIERIQLWLYNKDYESNVINNVWKEQQYFKNSSGCVQGIWTEIMIIDFIV